jgi:CelD/BcsL family acetyltransferase involved in cellulose biosynthesis
MAEFVLSDFATLRKPWTKMCQKSRANVLFSSADWSELWWQHFGSGSELYLGSVREDGRCLGIAPLRLENGKVRLIGSDDVCDFLDFIIEPGKETAFCDTLIAHLKGEGLTSIELSPLLPNSSVRSYFLKAAQTQGMSVACSQVDVTVGVDLPSDLPDYLSLLSGKQRHELLRKERRLNEEGEIAFRISEKAEPGEIDTFLHFFSESREDKNKFLTPEMESFFRAVINKASENNILNLGILELNKNPVAVTLGFNYRDDVYIYNSGYNPDYRWLSVGMLSKYYHIKHSIEAGKKRFDFLKGAERYKFHLGGKETSIFRCIIKNN